MMRKLLQLSAAVALAAAASMPLQAQSSTNGPIEDNVAVNQMGGLTLTATWYGGFSQTLSLANLGAGAWGWSSTNLDLRAPGTADTYFAVWSFNNARAANLQSLAFSSTGTNLMFDRTFGGAVGTPGSNVGYDGSACQVVFIVCLDTWNSTLSYSDAVALNPNAPVGDLYRNMTLTFGNGGIDGGFGTDAFMRFDTDMSASAITSTTAPEPSTYALMAAGLAVLGAVARRRHTNA